MRCAPAPIAKLSVSAKSYSRSPAGDSGCGTSRTSSPSPMRMMFGKVVLDDAEVVAVVRDVRRQQQRVATADDALLAQVGRVPVDFQLQLVGLDDLGRRAKPFAKLREESHVPVRGGLVVGEPRVGELLGAALRGAGRRASSCAGRSTSALRPHRPHAEPNTTTDTHAAAARPRAARNRRMIGEYRGAFRLEQPARDESRRISRTSASRADNGSPRLVPVWRDVLLDADTPVAAFAKLRHGPFAFLLESAPAGGETWARYTFMGTAPRAAWRLAGRRRARLDRRRAAGTTIVAPPIPSPISRRSSRDAEPVDAPEIGEFWSGAVGYFGYDVARLIERLPTPPARGVDVPDALFVFTDALVIFDNLRSQARVVAAARVEPNATDAQLDTAYDARHARRRSDGRAAPRSVGARAARPRPVGAARRGRARSTTSDKFLADVERVRRVHHRRRRVPGADRAAHRRSARLLVDGSLSRAARDQPVAVHVPPRARRHRDRRQLARAARSASATDRHGDAAADRRHAAARAVGRGRRAHDAGADEPTRRSAPSI